MSHVTGSIVIDRPVEEVFDAVADQTNEPHYNPSMTASRRVTAGPTDVGTHFLATILSRGKPMEVDIEVTRYVRPRVLGTCSVMAGSRAVGAPTRTSGIRHQGDLGLGGNRAGTCAAPRPARRDRRPASRTSNMDRAQRLAGARRRHRWTVTT